MLDSTWGPADPGDAFRPANDSLAMRRNYLTESRMTNVTQAPLSVKRQTDLITYLESNRLIYILLGGELVYMRVTGSLVVLPPANGLD